jgi:hypothetical protein
MACYTIDNPDSEYYTSAVFERLLQFVTENPGRCAMKQLEKSIQVKVRNVQSLGQAAQVLEKVLIPGVRIHEN